MVLTFGGEVDLEGFPVAIIDPIGFKKELGRATSRWSTKNSEFDGFVVIGVGLGVGYIEGHLVAFILDEWFW